MRLIDADALAIHKFPVTERDHLCEAIAYRLGWNNAIEAICENEPSVEKTGEWQITDSYPHNVYCSECHTKFAQTHWEVWEDGSLPRKYCPNCGATMKGEI